MKDLFDETFQEETAKINPSRLLKEVLKIFCLLLVLVLASAGLSHYLIFSIDTICMLGITIVDKNLGPVLCNFKEKFTGKYREKFCYAGLFSQYILMINK